MMEVQEILRSVRPLVGEVRPIRTVQETQPIEEYGRNTPPLDLVTRLTTSRRRLRCGREREKRRKGRQVGYLPALQNLSTLTSVHIEFSMRPILAMPLDL